MAPRVNLAEHRNKHMQRLAAAGKLFYLLDTVQVVDPLPPAWPSALSGEPCQPDVLLGQLLGYVLLVKEAKDLKPLQKDWPGYTIIALDTCEFYEGDGIRSGQYFAGEVWVKEQQDCS